MLEIKRHLPSPHGWDINPGTLPLEPVLLPVMLSYLSLQVREGDETILFFNLLAALHIMQLDEHMLLTN